MKSEKTTPKDAQTAVIKLWELVRNTAEITRDANVQSEEVFSNYAKKDNMIARKDGELDELKLIIKNYEENSNRLGEINETLLNQNDKLQEKLAEFDAIYKERNQLLAGNGELTQKNKFLSDKVNLLPELQQSNAAKENENVSLKEVLADKNLKISELTKLVTDFSYAQKEISRKNIELNEKINDIQSLKNDYAMAQSIIFSYRSQEEKYAKAHEKAIYLENELLKAEENMLAEQNGFELEKANFEQERINLTNEIHHKKNSISSHEQTISELMGRILVLENSGDDANSTMSEMKQQLAELAKTNAEQTETIAMTSGQVISQINEIDELGKSLQEYADLELQMSDQNEYVLLLEEELSGLKKKLEEETKSLQGSESNFLTLTSRFEELDTLAQSGDENIKSLKVALVNNSEQNLRQVAEIEELTQKINMMQEKMNSMQEQNLDLTQEFNNYNVLKNKFEILDELFENQKKENEVLLEYKRTLNNKITSNNGELDLLKSENEKLNARVSDYSVEVDLLNEELTKKTEKLSQKTEELSQKSEELSQKNEELNQKSEELSQKNEELNQKSEELSQKDEELNQKSEELSQKNEELNQKSEELSQKNEELSQKDEKLNLKNKEINQKNEEIIQKSEEIEIAKKEASLAKDVIFDIPSQERIDQLTQSLEILHVNLKEKDLQIEKLTQKAASLASRAASQNSLDLFAEYDRDNQKKLMNENAKLQAEINANSDLIEQLQSEINLQQSAELKDSQEEMITTLANDTAIKDSQITNLRSKNEALEELLRTRYEQIDLLEKDLNAQLEAKKNSEAAKAKIIEKVSSLIEKIEKMD